MNRETNNTKRWTICGIFKISMNSTKFLIPTRTSTTNTLKGTQKTLLTTYGTSSKEFSHSQILRLWRNKLTTISTSGGKKALCEVGKNGQMSRKISKKTRSTVRRVPNYSQTSTLLCIIFLAKITRRTKNQVRKQRIAMITIIISSSNNSNYCNNKSKCCNSKMAPLPLHLNHKHYQKVKTTISTWASLALKRLQKR